MCQRSRIRYGGVDLADKTPSLEDHYHIWIREKGHTHTELGPMYETVSATPLALALSGKSQKRTKVN